MKRENHVYLQDKEIHCEDNKPEVFACIDVDN